MNHEQTVFKKVIKARRNREWRLSNPRNKIIVSQPTNYKKISWWRRLLMWLKIL